MTNGVIGREHYACVSVIIAERTKTVSQILFIKKDISFLIESIRSLILFYSAKEDRLRFFIKYSKSSEDILLFFQRN